jgi:hypothetical protein
MFGSASIVLITINGNAAMLPQYAAHAPADMPSWLLTQPSHLSDIGMSPDAVTISTAIADIR